MFNIIQFKNYLQARNFVKEISFFKTLDSTNTYAKKIAEEGKAEGTIVLTDEQTNGRGRFSRVWISDKEKNLTFSIILRPRFALSRSSLLPFALVVAIVKTLNFHYQLKTECKWPNDILLNKKKLCGMLLETSIHNEQIDYIIVGIGLNVNQNNFPEELKETATSLFIETQHEWNREELLFNILLECEKEYISLCENESSKILSEWKSYSTMFGKEISIHQNGNVLHGIAVDIASNGELLVNVENKLVKFSSGDVSIRI
ncbi:MAG: biotin--[acetyl-CoA-carboxylase] ligase [Ignavibacteria bacterium]|nr:biotin--[acetyl-CoA-carboxylase] ligase [Ignavibacteria bacterium]